MTTRAKAQASNLKALKKLRGLLDRIVTDHGQLEPWPGGDWMAYTSEPGATPDEESRQIAEEVFAENVDNLRAALDAGADIMDSTGDAHTIDELASWLEIHADGLYATPETRSILAAVRSLRSQVGDLYVEDAYGGGYTTFRKDLERARA